MQQGICYIIWGDYNQAELDVSIQSAHKLSLPIEIIEVEPQDGYLSQLEVFDKTPFDITLYLDTDTVLLDDNLDFAFKMAQEHGIALCMDPVNLSSRYGEWFIDRPEYNFGAIFFNKKILDEFVYNGVRATWYEILNRNAKFLETESSQAVLTYTLHEEWINPYVLPHNYNFMAHMQPNPLTGEIKIWHSHFQNIPATVWQWNLDNKKRDIKKTARYEFPGKFIELFKYN